jgi:hypothetical protein
MNFRRQDKRIFAANEILPNVVAIGQTDAVSDALVKELLQNKGNTKREFAA